MKRIKSMTDQEVIAEYEARRARNQWDQRTNALKRMYAKIKSGRRVLGVTLETVDRFDVTTQAAFWAKEERKARRQLERAAARR